MITDAIVATEGLTRRFGGSSLLRRGEEVVAVDDVSLTLARGKTLGLVGESGSGKTTFGRMIVGLLAPTAGRILVDGRDATGLAQRERNRRIQYVFQDPYSSLNPRRTIGRAIAVPLRHLVGMGRRDAAARVLELMAQVGLRPDMADRYPHELSGGQRQRVGIARALGVEPDVLVLDEPVSALDVSIQAQILALLADLQDELGLTYLFISHDLAVVESVCDEIAVMYRGRIVEQAPRAELFEAPRDAYTKRLLAAVPGSRPKRALLSDGRAS